MHESSAEIINYILAGIFASRINHRAAGIAGALRLKRPARYNIAPVRMMSALKRRATYPLYYIGKKMEMHHLNPRNWRSILEAEAAASFRLCAYGFESSP